MDRGATEHESITAARRALRESFPGKLFGEYIQWLEVQVVELREHRQRLLENNNRELERYRTAQAKVERQNEALIDMKRQLEETLALL